MKLGKISFGAADSETRDLVVSQRDGIARDLFRPVPVSTVAPVSCEVPMLWRGVDAAGHRVYVTATRRQILAGETMAKCADCGGYVAATWEVPAPEIRLATHTVLVTDLR